MKYQTAVITAVAILLSKVAIAGPECADEQTDQWLSESKMKAKVEQMGYTYDKFKISRGNCYEIYGHNADGQKVEVYFDPITGDVVEEEIES